MRINTRIVNRKTPCQARTWQGINEGLMESQQGDNSMETPKEQLERLCAELTQAKENEDQWAAIRKDHENAIASMVAKQLEGTDKAEAGKYRITVTSKLTRTLDYPAYCAIEADIPEGIRCVELKPAIDLKKLRAMDMVRPGFSAAFITTKPSKPSVKVEVNG